MRRADLYDPSADAWTRLSDLPGNGMVGFGASAWSVGERVYASSADGVLYALGPDADAWTTAGRLSAQRFFHRLLPSGNGGLLAVAGASQEEGHLTSTEYVRPSVERAAARVAKPVK